MKFVKPLSVFLFWVCMSFLPGVSRAGDLDMGYSLEQSGQLEAAAEFFCRYATSHPNDGTNTPEALLRCGRLLDSLQDVLTGRAEKRCYWGRRGDPDCMRQDATALNSRFGAGSFQYEHAILYIPYTGIHYRTLMNRFPSNKYAPEADFYLLLKELTGHPDVVLPKIKAFLSRHKKGEWNRRGLLLFARVNEDVWYIHRKWSWVLYNYQISPEELIIRAEPYRQEALRTYKALMKEGNTFEGQAAAREYALLDANQEDGHTYSIVNDSSAGTLSTWGIAAPVPTSQPDADVHGSQPAFPPVSSPPPGYKPPEPKEETPRVPQRWN